MANLNAPKGFVPSRYMDGSAWNGATNVYFIPQADGNQFNPGDAVKSAAVTDANYIPGVTKITNGTDTIRGILVGVLSAGPGAQPSLVGTNLDLTIQNIPASKNQDYYVLVVDDPAVVYEIQDDGTAALTTAQMSKNASFTVANPTSPQQNSATVLNVSSIATTQGLNLRLLGAVQRADNDPTLVNAKWLVKINQHELQGNTAGI